MSIGPCQTSFRPGEFNKRFKGHHAPDDTMWFYPKGGTAMNRKSTLTFWTATVVLAVLAGIALAQQDKYTLQVPNGLAFAEFRGYEAWQVVSISQDGDLIAAILANPVMIDAYLSGAPGNGKPFPDGAKLAKIHWNPKKMEPFPAATVPGTQHDMDFMVKDSKRFADSGGWGWAVFDYDAASDTFTPGTLADHPPQGNDAKCGFACHTSVKTRDYVFTDYGHR
jgi:Cytochrome P460